MIEDKPKIVILSDCSPAALSYAINEYVESGYRVSHFSTSQLDKGVASGIMYSVIVERC